MAAATALPFPNDYHLRTVAEASSKPCYICHRPTTKVLITADNKDFFYTCATHLKDRGFVSPVIDEKAEAEKREKEALAREIEAVKKEYEEKMKKKGKGKGKDKEKEKAKAKDDAKSEEEKERDEKIKAIEAKATGTAAAGQQDDEGPRQFTLHRQYYQMRLERRREMDRAKRDQQRLKDPTFFPSAPTGDVS